ncbi:hypothetical protein C1645_748583 [Glomus cerebriforme]|uniref:Uncharacterized protein n=1 Tax=Glomus cerebriforme TaxID=658196 RepID=A0A397TQT4_9GLOM|nr:hypothetical protein C1645_748583 [Glomus cerebriforme]
MNGNFISFFIFCIIPFQFFLMINVTIRSKNPPTKILIFFFKFLINITYTYVDFFT